MSIILIGFSYFFTPVLIAWAWIRVVRLVRLRDRSSWLSVIALAFTTLSGLLAVGSVIYADAIGGFRYFDPRLMRIFQIGLLLSLIAVASGLTGIAFRNPLRWQAPLASFGILLFWYMSAISE